MTTSYAHRIGEKCLTGESSTSDNFDLLNAAIIAILKQEVSKFTFASHNVGNKNLSFGVTIEYAAGTTYHLAIAAAFKFWWNFARSWMPFKAFDGGEHSLYQRTRRCRIFKRDVFCNFI